MQTYIALLRGINVSGQKMIKMTDLKTLLAKQSFSNIKTYLQSGNAIFDTAINNKQEIVAIIQKAIKEAYGFDVPTMVFTRQELMQIVDQNPFIQQIELDSTYFHVTFLADQPQHLNTDTILSKKTENYPIL